MNEMEKDTLIARLADLIRRQDDTLRFTVLEIGAAPMGTVEPFYRLLDLFPGSRVVAFEVDREVCEKLNRESRPEIRFFATALGRTEETRTFYETQHPMCSSLYEPNSKLLSLYNNLEVADIKSVQTIDTVSLDHFAAENGIGAVDFIKIDVQGAELDVFQGGRSVLGDVCAQLRQQDIMFHKFLTRGTRSLAPIILNNDACLGTQDIWADALFISDPLRIPALPAQKLLKLAMLAQIYDSPDLTFYCFQHYDRLKGSDLKRQFVTLFQG